MSDLTNRYQRLYERVASPKSIDCGRATIYMFEKYCKHCGQGMKKPNQWDRRTLKALFKKGFCTDQCKGYGKRYFSSFPLTVSGDGPSLKKEYLLEELAFVSLQIKKERAKENPILSLVREAHNLFGRMSEKLSWLEEVTKTNWGPSKFYWWLQKI